MQRANVNGVSLEYEVQGSGEPVVFIHGGLIADTFATLMREPVLTDSFTLIRYRRRGYAGSSRPDAPTPISGQAADCVALLRHLGFGRAHVVGHSYGGVIALQVALDAPDAVRSLSLLEPALLDVPSGPILGDTIARATELNETGDSAAALDLFLQAVEGKEYRAALDAALPGGFDQAVADTDNCFRREGPALQEWTFTREDAARIKQSVLSVLGADSASVWQGFGEIHQRLLHWFPQAKRFVLPRATHQLHVKNPHDMAVALADFFSDN